MLISIIGTRGFPGIQGGVEMHCEHIYPLMDGNDVTLRVYRRKPYLTEKSNKRYHNIKYIDLPSTRMKGFEAVFHTFISAIHILFHRPDVVHIHNIGPAMFAPLLRIFGLKVVLTYHSPNYEHKKWGFFARNLLLASEFLALRFSNEIIFVNSFQMDKYPLSIKKKSVYIPNGVIDVTPSEKTDYIDSLGLDPNQYILGVGRLTPEKGFEYLIEAANKTPEVKHLVIAGASDHDTHYYDKLKSLDIHKKVIFTGYTAGEQLRQLYSHAKLFVLSSVNEGFPLVMLEAMKYELPMIVSDIPATHLIDLPEENYTPKADSDALANALKQRCCAPKKNIKYDMTQYNWKSIAKITASIYEGTEKVPIR